MNEAPDERPTIRVMVGFPDPHQYGKPRIITTVDLLDVPGYVHLGYGVILYDPETVDAWEDWRSRHPEVSAEATEFL